MWEKIYVYPMKITKYCTLQWFKISINHNILVINKRLQYMGIKDDRLCTFCKNEEETVRMQHNKIIFKIIFIIAAKFQYLYPPVKKLFLFGLEKNRANNIKYQLHITICQISYLLFPLHNNPLMLGILKNNIYFMYEINMEIAYANNNLDNFQKEWRPYQDLLNIINTY